MPVEAPKDTDRQLSKKELKKKELAELDAVLAELGYPTSEPSGQEDPHGKHIYIYIIYISFNLCELVHLEIFGNYIEALYLYSCLDTFLNEVRCFSVVRRSWQVHWYNCFIHSTCWHIINLKNM